jgi:outer membrane protein assembly factor BamB
MTLDASRRRPRLAPLIRPGITFALLLGLAGCATIYEYLPVPPAFSLRWLWNTKKPGPLPDLKASAAASASWQVSVGKAVPGFAPLALADAVYVAAADGGITRIDPATGRTVWRISANRTLSAGVGADANIVVVGTDKGDVLAFDTNGSPKWTAKVSTEVIAPPRVSEGIVAIFAGDGSIHALSAADGSKKWVNQRIAPSLTVRNFAGGALARGALFVGTAGGRLLAFDIATGIIGWDATVANPKGATELERIADITSLPLVDQQQACAVAYQGRLACFDITRGTLNWSRDVSSLYGMATDGKNLYVTDDKGAVQALDRTNGASVWKQDLLAQRKIGGPQIVGDLIGVVDIEGYLHLLSPINGAYVGRLATDGTAATAQPVPFLGSVLWQSAGGTLYAVTAK